MRVRQVLSVARTGAVQLTVMAHVLTLSPLHLFVAPPPAPLSRHAYRDATEWVRERGEDSP